MIEKDRKRRKNFFTNLSPKLEVLSQFYCKISHKKDRKSVV
jgi:hypothetical protein